MLNTITLLDSTSKTINITAYKLDSKLQKIKSKIAYKLFKQNKYINDYIKNFDNKYDTTFIDNTGFLCRLKDFDFKQIPQTLKENLKQYMEDYYGFYYYSDDYNEGFTINSYDNIYISYENEIFADFSKKSLSFKKDLELFLKLELLQANNGIYPDIVYCDYYGNYSSDYTMPEELQFLKTGMHNKEDRLIFFIEKLIELYDSDIYNYYDNFIIEEFTPEFIKKIDNNLSIDLLDITLDDDFELHFSFDIPTILKEKQLEKLNIINYTYTKYNTTLININVNIKEYLQKELQHGYSYDGLKKDSINA